MIGAICNGIKLLRELGNGGRRGRREKIMATKRQNPSFSWISTMSLSKREVSTSHFNWWKNQPKLERWNLHQIWHFYWWTHVNRCIKYSITFTSKKFTITHKYTFIWFGVLFFPKLIWNISICWPSKHP